MGSPGDGVVARAPRDVIKAFGLTGGIGSGKSTAATLLAQRGAEVIDADTISRHLTAPLGVALGAIRDAFGESVAPLGGELDRAALRELVFRDTAARARLEAILHPMIGAEMDRRIAQATGSYALLVVPLLFETGRFLERVEATIVVDCAEALQLARARARSGLSQETVRAVMAAQWPRWRRLQAADMVLWNGGEVGGLDAQCRRLHDQLLRR